MTQNSPTEIAARFVEGFRLEDYAFYLMGHVDHLYALGMEDAMDANRVSRVEWRCLATLAQHDRLSVGDLAAITLIKRPTVSRVADRLARDGLVTRRPRADDQRVTDVTLTEEGRRVFRNVLRITGLQYARAVQGLAEKDISDLNRILRRMIRNLSQSPLTLLAGQMAEQEGNERT